MEIFYSRWFRSRAFRTSHSTLQQLHGRLIALSGQFINLISGHFEGDSVTKPPFGVTSAEVATVTKPPFGVTSAEVAIICPVLCIPGGQSYNFIHQKYYTIIHEALFSRISHLSGHIIIFHQPRFP